MTTIEEARQFVESNRKEGCKCPACDQFCKEYNYNLNLSIALALIKLYKFHQDGTTWVHVNTQLRQVSGGYFSLAKWWGLIVQKKKDGDESKRVSGYWALTRKGIDFVEGKLAVPSYVEMYNGEVLGFSEYNMTISDCLGSKFNYRDLMGNYYKEPIEPKQELLL